MRIVSAVAAPAANGEPAACIVKGAANERVGADGKAYALGFELRLPEAWNGRFLHQVNGGNDGEVLPAIGDPNEHQRLRRQTRAGARLRRAEQR